MASLLDEELELNPALQDWQLMPPDAPISSALQPSEPRKALDVSRGAPSGLTRPTDAEQPARGRMGGGGDMDALKQAMAQARQNRLGAELGMAGETISRAFVPQQQSSGFWQRQLEGADRPVQELQAFQKQRGEEEDRKLKEADRAGKSAYTQALQQQIQAGVARREQEAETQRQRSDAGSDFTKTWRSAFVQTPEGKALAEAMGPDFERLTPAIIEGSKGASDMLKSLRPAPARAENPYMERSLDLRAQEVGLKRQKQEQDRLDREAKGMAAAEEKRIDREAKQTAGNQSQQKDFEFIKGLEDTTRTLEANLNQLDEKVAKFGTQVFTGPEGENMASLIDDIATGYAKMKDPSTGVKEGEVAVEMRKFWDPKQVKSAWSIKNETARAIVQNLRDRIAQRAQRSYDIRGFGERKTTGPVIPPWMRTEAPTRPSAAAPPGGEPTAAPTPPAGAVKMQRNPTTGATRWVDAAGKEVK